MTSMVFGLALISTFIGYMGFYWFIREKLRHLYYQLDRKRIDFERQAEMEELLEEEESVKSMVNEDHGQATPDYIHVTSDLKDGFQVRREKGMTPIKWSLDKAEEPTRRSMRQAAMKQKELSDECLAIESKSDEKG